MKPRTLFALLLLATVGVQAQEPAATKPEKSLIPMAEVKGGTFKMGAAPGAPHEWTDGPAKGSPPLQVSVGDFSIGKTPVTQAQWKTVMGTNPSDQQGDDLPVEQVTWFEAVAFCNRLSQKEGLTPVYRDYGRYADGTMRLVFADAKANGYRLPTEKEWEYAARGGSLTKGSQLAGGDDAETVGWYRGNSGNRTHPVGQKVPNELGLYDMSGNVLQWCWDGYEADLFKEKKPGDPCLSYKNARSLRGSSFWNRAESLDVTKRNNMPAGLAYNYIGFRVARGPSPDLETKATAEWQQKMLKTFTNEITLRPGAPEVIPDKMLIPPSPAEPLKNVTTAEVRQWKGAPTLFINDKPNTGLMLWRHAGLGEGGAPEFTDFRQAGIHLIQPDMPLSWVWKSDGSIDTAKVDGIMKEILAGNPEVQVMPRVHMHQPSWWRAAHPERRNAGYNPAADKYATGDWDINTYADQKWRKEASAAGQALIRYLEEHYGDHLIGYVIGAGDTGEWSPGWVRGGEFDFSPIQRDAFRKWLKDPKAEIPRDRLRDGRPEFFNDPAKDAMLMNYFKFESDVTTDTLLQFADAFQSTLARMKRKRILGAFYGYSFAMFFRMGSHDFNRVLQSPNINFITSLSDYKWRGPGGLYVGTTIPASLRLHGKLLYNEEDSATPLSKRVRPGNKDRYGPPDWEITRNLSIHKIVASFLEGGTSWYMDWLGEDWYRSPEILPTIAATQKLLTEQLGKDRTSVAQIAVFGSERAVEFVRPREDALAQWRSLQREPLARLGAPFDFYDIADLEQATTEHNYKLLIFLEVPKVDRTKLPQGVATLWTYLPGYSAEAASQSIGFSVLAGAPDKKVPLLNPRASVEGNSGAEPFGPNVWRKGNTYWAPAPPVALDDLRKIAELAGVHFYGGAGDQIFADKNLLMVHSASAGKKSFKLPAKCKVTDAFTDEVVATNADTFEVDLKLGETRVWRTGI